jgi:hypothetical protein
VIIGAQPADQHIRQHRTDLPHRHGLTLMAHIPPRRTNRRRPGQDR